MTVNHAKNLLRHRFPGPIRIDRDQPPLHPVVIRYRLGLRFISRQTPGNDFFTIIVAEHQLGSVHITQLIYERWL